VSAELREHLARLHPEPSTRTLPNPSPQSTINDLRCRPRVPSQCKHPRVGAEEVDFSHSAAASLLTDLDSSLTLIFVGHDSRRDIDVELNVLGFLITPRRICIFSDLSNFSVRAATRLETPSTIKHVCPGHSVTPLCSSAQAFAAIETTDIRAAGRSLCAPTSRTGFKLFTGNGRRRTLC